MAVTSVDVPVDGYLFCLDAGCVGYLQEEAKLLKTTREFTYVELGGDSPGVERSVEYLRPADESAMSCPHCDQPRAWSEQVRPVYARYSGQTKDPVDHNQVKVISQPAAQLAVQAEQMRVLQEQVAALAGTKPEAKRGILGGRDN